MRLKMSIQSKNNLAYVMTYKNVLADIKRNRLTPGARLIPITELAKKYDVSYMTAQRAIKMLQDEGVLEAKKGSGIFIKNLDNKNENGSKGNGFSYSPNNITSNIQDKSAVKSISIVLPFWLSWHGKAAVYSTVRGFMEISQKQGWKTDLITKDGNFVDLKFSQKIIDRDVDGLLWIAPNPWDITNIVRLIDKGIEVIPTGRGFPDIPLDAVEIDLLDLGSQIVNFCISKEHDKILILSGNIEEPFLDTISATIVKGIKNELQTRNINLSDNVVCQACMPPEDLKHAKLAIEEHADANAIICMSETIFPAIEDLDKRNFYKDPSSIVIINCTGEHGHNPDYVGRIPVVKISRPYEDIGRAAGLRLLNKWQGEKPNGLDLKAKMIIPDSL
ncbi:DNA-binding transcriptional regulator FrlR [Limihaloglobus sulfuriphilus]|uniref:DNA-binding transcriptional regulator FrlR n=1 Tax=Limihaloglobus sulfuriphilus TaxID=1851148 RepID=A0A1Q2MFF6_9BACT|nr:GntR family transcriptional regulator [Limihaloglobus sulfuriphilus]AQQ70982.1 DNA-binding transcriptional regulator FrlR [Limihaloglobus sulfuriphilus]